MAGLILKRADEMGLDNSLFVMDVRLLNTAELPHFYCELFKAWSVYKKKNKETAVSLHWLLEELVMGGARLYMEDVLSPGLRRILRAAGVVMLRQVVEAAGSDLQDGEAVAERLGVRSSRLIHLVLTKWRKALTEEELLLLKEYGERVEEPDMEDPFPEITLTANLEGSSGKLLD